MLGIARAWRSAEGSKRASRMDWSVSSSTVGSEEMGGKVTTAEAILYT